MWVDPHGTYHADTDAGVIGSSSRPQRKCQTIEFNCFGYTVVHGTRRNCGTSADMVSFMKEAVVLIL